ncbi:hypothetical protein [Rhizobium herbae]
MKKFLFGGASSGKNPPIRILADSSYFCHIWQRRRSQAVSLPQVVSDRIGLAKAEISPYLPWTRLDW